MPVGVWVNAHFWRTAGRCRRLLYNRRGIAQNLAKWLTSPHTKLMRLSDQYSSHLKPSFSREKSTQTQHVHTHTRWPSKSSLILTMALHWQHSGTPTQIQTRSTHTQTHTCTRDGAYLLSPVRVLNFPKELPLKAHRRRAELIILDIPEQVSYNNNSHSLLCLLNRSGQMSSGELLKKTLWDYHSVNVL